MEAETARKFVRRPGRWPLRFSLRFRSSIDEESSDRKLLIRDKRLALAELKHSRVCNTRFRFIDLLLSYALGKTTGHRLERMSVPDTPDHCK